MRRHAHRRLFAKLEKKLKNGVSHFFVEFDREVAVCNAEEGEQDGGTRQPERTDALAGAAAAGDAGPGAACCDGRPGVCGAWV